MKIIAQAFERAVAILELHRDLLDETASRLMAIRF